MNAPIESHSKNINTNTGISIGIVVLLLGGFVWVIKGQNEMSLQAITTKAELANKMDKLETRIHSLESSNTSWTSTDMFKWAVHLQQANPQIKVPEPEVTSK